VPDSKAEGDVIGREKRHPLRHLSIEPCQWNAQAAGNSPHAVPRPAAVGQSRTFSNTTR